MCYPVGLLIIHGSYGISVNACKLLQVIMNITETRTNYSKRIQSSNKNSASDNQMLAEGSLTHNHWNPPLQFLIQD